MDRSYVYILTNRHNSVFYVGVTNNIGARTHIHKKHLNRSFTSKYNVTKLVYYEVFYSIVEAIKREKRLKKWNRSWKIKLIETINPEWRDLSGEDGVIESVER